MILSSRVVLAVVMFLALSAVPVRAQEAAPAAPAAPAAGPRLDDWIVIGPGGGGGQFYPTISPHDPNRAFVRCDMTGSFITHDGGNSWRMFNLRGATRFFVFDPVDPDVMYVNNVGLFRSADAGKTWNLVHPRPEDVEKFIVAGDHGEVSIRIKRPAAESPAGPAPRFGPMPWGSSELVTALAVDPADSKKLYASISAGGRATLRVSGDWGQTWNTLAALPSAARGIFADPKSPGDSRTLYVITNNAVSLWADGKLTNHSAPPGVSGFTDTAAGFAEDGRLIVYGIAWARVVDGRMEGGVYVSRDGGESWSQANDDLVKKMIPDARAPSLRSIGACLTRGEVAYLSYNGLRTGSAENENYFGVAKTADGGKTWRLVWKEYDTVGENMVPGWISLRFGPGWGENPISIGVAPTDPDIVYGTDYGRTLRSADGGKTWAPAYSKKWEDGSWTTTGLDVTTCYGVHFDPFDKDRIFISYTDIGLFASSNGGVTWESATTQGVPRGWVNTTYWMEFDPAVKGRVWAVMSGVHDLPRPKMWRRGGVRANGGVCMSEDGGRTWKQSTEGMAATPCTHVLVDPESPADARVLYVAGFGTGLWKSADGGKTWKLKNKGIEGEQPFAWRLARDKNGVLYLVVARRSEDGNYNNEEDGALYRSKDGAETWEKIPLPAGLNGPNGIAIDPGDPNRLYLAAWGRYQTDGAVMGGIWLSTDAGKTWKNVLAKDQYIYDVTIDPADPNALYASGFTSSAWRSQDRGRTWSRIPGFNFKWGHRVIPNPYNPDRIYVTTFGGSVWYGPAGGDPDTVEDIVTPVAKAP